MCWETRGSPAQTPGMASTGHDTPTRKKSGRLVAMNSTTAISRRLNPADELGEETHREEEGNGHQKDVERTPRVEKP